MIVYFKNVVAAFKARWQQLGGKIVDEETYQDQAFGGNNVQNAVSRLNDEKADVIVTSTAGAFGALVGVHHRPAHARQQHADPQLVGG